MTTARRPDLITLLDREIDKLDALVGEVRNGVRGPYHFGELEERADAIGLRLRAAFRESRR